MKTDKHRLMEEIYDQLMGNDYPMTTDIKTEFTDSWIDCEKVIIYLHGSKSLPNMRLEIYKD